mgnify:CR=1 FL=1
MYKIASLLFLILISSMSVNSVFAQEISGQKISLTTDNTAYEEGDIITVTGNIDKILPGTPIILQIFIDRTQVDVAQIDVSSQGDFSTTFVASGPLWSNDGDVSIRASYGTMYTETNFTFFSQVAEDTFLLNQEVEIPNEGTFDIPYTMKGGTVQTILLNQENLGLDININTTSDGSITLELARNYIDSTKPDGSNEDFIIIIYNSQVDEPVQTEFLELESTDESRVIQIPIKSGDNLIQIIGTFVIPEFGTITQFVLIIAIFSIIAITAKTKFRLNNF